MAETADDWMCPERGRHDKEGRQRALVDAATAVFAERGFDAATTREIAERAGCSEGLIHRYFGGKRGLLMSVLELRAGEAMRDFDAMAPPGDDLGQEIDAILRYGLTMAWRAKDFMRVSVGQAIVDPEIGQQVGRLFWDERARRVRHRLERHRAAGRISAEANLEAMAQALVGLGFACGFMGRVVFQRGDQEVGGVVSSAAEVIVRGLAPASPGGDGGAV